MKITLDQAPCGYELEAEYRHLRVGDHYLDAKGTVLVSSNLNEGATRIVLTPIERWRPAEFLLDYGKICRVRDYDEGTWVSRRLVGYAEGNAYPFIAAGPGGQVGQFKQCEVKIE